MQITGFYFEPNQSAKREAILQLISNEQLFLKDTSNNELQISNLIDLDISPRLANTPRMITFKDGALFETLENEFVDLHLSSVQKNNFYSLIHQFEHRSKYIIFALLFVIAFSWVFVQFGVPATAKIVADLLPSKADHYLAQGTLAILDKTYFSESELSNQRQTELKQLMLPIFKNYPDLKIQLAFRNGGAMGANAFAIPDGHIVFTDQMIELSESDSELLAILGHEIGHLEKRHLVRRVIQDSLLAMLVVLVTGDVSYASSVLVALPALLVELAYSRQFELEADDFALKFLKSNNIAPVHFANIMQRLVNSHKEKSEDKTDDENKSLISAYFSTHPVTDERILPFLNAK